MNRIRIKEDIIRNENAKKDITIIHIADIHFSINTKFKDLEKLKNKISLNNPDYLVITGDLIDEPSITKNKYKIKELLVFLTELSKFTKVLISLGNHDIFTEEDKTFFKKINEIKDIYILDNTSYQDEFIYIAGLTLPTQYYYNISNDESAEALLNELKNQRKLLGSRLPRNIPKVMLIHSPLKLTEDQVLDKLSDYDLILSGHTHNGMVPSLLDKLIKNNKGLVAPNKKLFPDISRGKVEKYHKGKNVTVIINGGITKLSNKSGKFLSSFNWLYDKNINKIIITKKRGKCYE